MTKTATNPGAVIVPFLTPLTSDGRIDAPALERCASRCIEAGVDGLFVNSTTGEYLALPDELRRENLALAAEMTSCRTRLLAGVSDIATVRVLRNIEQAAKYEPAAYVVLPPLFYPAGREELIRFFTAVADAAPAPVILYNNPGVIRNVIDMETVRRLIEHPNIAGIKDSSGDFRNLQRLVELKSLRPDFRVYASKAYLWQAGLAAGADGMIDALLNLVPEMGVALYRAYQAGDTRKVAALQQRVLRLLAILELGPAVPHLKAAMHLLGFCEVHVHHPFTKPDAPALEAVQRILKQASLM